MCADLNEGASGSLGWDHDSGSWRAELNLYGKEVARLFPLGEKSKASRWLYSRIDRAFKRHTAQVNRSSGAL